MTNLTAALPSGVYLSPASTHLLHFPTPTSTTVDFVDHYAVMGLDSWATSEEIKAAHRRLRGEYFGSNNVVKYRALQAAFDVLADREARWNYDGMWRQRRGLPAPPQLEKWDEGNADVSVAERVITLERKGTKDVVCPAPAPRQVEVEAEVEKAIMSSESEARKEVVARKPLIGTRPYNSYIPILAMYKGYDMHPTWKCTRPKYILSTAKQAWP